MVFCTRFLVYLRIRWIKCVFMRCTNISISSSRSSSNMNNHIKSFTLCFTHSSFESLPLNISRFASFTFDGWFIFKYLLNTGLYCSVVLHSRSVSEKKKNTTPLKCAVEAYACLCASSSLLSTKRENKMRNCDYICWK